MEMDAMILVFRMLSYVDVGHLDVPFSQFLLII